MGERSRYYPQLEIPDRFTITTGGEEGLFIEQTKDKFFSDVLDVLGFDLEARRHFVEEEVYELAIPSPIDLEPRQLTDRRINILLVMRKMVATVVANRDDYNFWDVGFASYLNPELEAQIKDAYRKFVSVREER